jgi:hypothetical protein
MVDLQKLQLQGQFPTLRTIDAQQLALSGFG